MKRKHSAKQHIATSADVVHLLGILARVTRRIVDDESGKGQPQTKRELKP